MVVLFLVGFIVVQMAEPMLPSVVGSILMLILVVFVGYYIAIYFSELGSRSALNYDELDIPTKNPGDKDEKSAKLRDNVSDLIPNAETCMDGSCCEKGSKYNTALGKCIPHCYVLDQTKPVYEISTGLCVSSSGHSGSGYINTQVDGFTLGGSIDSKFQTSGEKYVDKSRMSLPMSAVGGASTGGLTPSNEGVDKYSYV